MKKTKIIVVEDKALIAQDIKMKLGRLGYEWLGHANKAADALALIRDLQPELILLDINLNQEIDGIEIAALINQQFQLPFIYLTAFADEETLNRVKLTKPYGYIVKPFTENDLKVAIELALAKFKQEKLTHLSTPPESKADESIFIKVDDKRLRIRFRDVELIEACDNYCLIKIAEKQHIVRFTLKELEEKVAAQAFMRIHRSYIVNLDKIDAIEGNMVFIEGRSIPIGKSYKEALLKALHVG